MSTTALAPRPRIFKGEGDKTWTLSIPPALAPTPADAFTDPSDPDSTPVGLYGDTPWRSWNEAVQVLSEWGTRRYPDLVLRYVLEMGVDTPDRGRVCALEVGPFSDKGAALSFVDNVRGTTPASAESYARDLGIPSDPYDGEPGDEDRFLAGVTLSAFNDDNGTDPSRARDLY